MAIHFRIMQSEMGGHVQLHIFFTCTLVHVDDRNYTHQITHKMMIKSSILSTIVDDDDDKLRLAVLMVIFTLFHKNFE